MNGRRLQTFAFLVLGSVLSLFLPRLAHAQFYLPNDIRIEAPGVNVPAEAAAFSGVWAGGAWDGILPHVLIVERVSVAGEASVIYSWGDAPDWNTKGGFSRVQGKVENGRLSFYRGGAEVRVEYVIGATGDLNGTYTGRRTVSKVFLTKTSLEKLGSLAPSPVVALHEETLRIPVKYAARFGRSKELRLEATLFRPNQTG